MAAPYLSVRAFGTSRNMLEHTDMPPLFSYLSLGWSHSCTQTVRQPSTSASGRSGSKVTRSDTVKVFTSRRGGWCWTRYPTVGCTFASRHGVSRVLFFFFCRPSCVCFVDCQKTWDFSHWFVKRLK